MKPPTRDDWERLIVRVAGALEHERIPYHLDASTALYVHGIDFEMDDLDITVKWGCLEQTRELFKQYAPTPISSAASPSFQFEVDSLIVHVMAHQSSTGIGAANDRTQVTVAHAMVWTKTVEFYHRHIGADHPLKPLVSDWLRQQVSTPSTNQQPHR